MPAYSVELTDRANKQLKNLDKPVRARVIKVLDTLADDPRPDGMKALTGQAGLFRIRTGDWRIIYRIDDGRVVVLVVEIAHRSKIYRRL